MNDDIKTNGIKTLMQQKLWHDTNHNVSNIDAMGDKHTDYVISLKKK